MKAEPLLQVRLTSWCLRELRLTLPSGPSPPSAIRLDLLFTIANRPA
jgi:hypothetical protein